LLTQRNRIFFKKIYLHFEQKHLIPFKILSIGGNTLVQSFFPPCEASLEMLKLAVVFPKELYYITKQGRSVELKAAVIQLAGMRGRKHAQ
jgi:hypothetical protein